MWLSQKNTISQHYCKVLMKWSHILKDVLRWKMNTVILTSALIQKQSSSCIGFLIKRCSENSNFIEIPIWHGIAYLHIFRIPFPKTISGGLLLSTNGSLVDEFLASVNVSQCFPEKISSSCFRFFTWHVYTLPEEKDNCFKYFNAL